MPAQRTPRSALTVGGGGEVTVASETHHNHQQNDIKNILSGSEYRCIKMGHFRLPFVKHESFYNIPFCLLLMVMMSGLISVRKSYFLTLWGPSGDPSTVPFSQDNFLSF